MLNLDFDGRVNPGRQKSIFRTISYVTRCAEYFWVTPTGPVGVTRVGRVNAGLRTHFGRGNPGRT